MEDFLSSDTPLRYTKKQDKLLSRLLPPCLPYPDQSELSADIFPTIHTDFLRIVAAIVSDEFLEFSAQRGNDLRESGTMLGGSAGQVTVFPGLKGGCKWYTEPFPHLKPSQSFY
jgi:hypothetical protein